MFFSINLAKPISPFMPLCSKMCMLIISTVLVAESSWVSQIALWDIFFVCMVCAKTNGINVLCLYGCVCASSINFEGPAFSSL